MAMNIQIFYKERSGILSRCILSIELNNKEECDDIGHMCSRWQSPAFGTVSSYLKSSRNTRVALGHVADK